MKPATTSIVLYDYVIHKSGEYPVMLRVTYQRKSKYYHINNYYFSQKNYEKLMGEKPREEFKKAKTEVFKRQNEAIQIIEKLPYFTFEQFDKYFLYGKISTNDNIFSWFESEIAKLEKEERIKTKNSFKNTLESLKKFTKKTELLFYDITVDFLNEFEKWHLVKLENSSTTVSMYVRNIRNLFNQAISDGIILNDSYPFGKKKYVVPSGKNTKKALTLSDIQKIYSYPSIENSSEDRWKAMWLFSYLCNGANVKDVCLLKYKNIFNGKITFTRGKTKKTKRSQQFSITAIVTEEMQMILDKWGNINDSPDSYIFPILSKEMDAAKISATIDQTTKNINKYIDRVAKAVGISKKVTTYTARHSFATVLKRSGASTEFISESFGHADLKTTKIYLDSFEDDAKIENANKLLAFKNNN